MRYKTSAPPPAVTGGNVGAVPFQSTSPVGDRQNVSCQNQSQPSIAMYDRGCMLDAGTVGNPTGRNGGQTQRGVVSGWSSKSRGRMRKFLMTHRPPDGFLTYAVTLTVPGPPLSLEARQRLWNHYQVCLRRQGCCAVWRLELQERGQPHWHCIVSRPDRHPADHVMAWWDCLRALPPVDWGQCMQVRRDALPGADMHAVASESAHGEAAWLRYMYDHSTKLKQAQIAQDGRHWGVIGRKLYRRVMPDSRVELTRAQWVVLLRILRRLYTPTLADSRAPFGRRLGYVCRRGSVGRSCWFGSVETQARAIEYALAVRPPDYDHYMSDDGRVTGRPTSLPREQSPDSY
jgi:hypothetical protein